MASIATAASTGRIDRRPFRNITTASAQRTIGLSYPGTVRAAAEVG